MAARRVFVDGLEKVSMMDGMIHLDFFNYVSGADRTQPLNKEVTEEMILSTDGFRRIHAAVDKLFHQLQQAGLLPGENEPAAEKGQEPASPNFRD